MMSYDIGKTAIDRNVVNLSPPASHSDSSGSTSTSSDKDSREVSGADTLVDSGSGPSKTGHAADTVQGQKADPLQGQTAVPLQGHTTVPCQAVSPTQLQELAANKKVSGPVKKFYGGPKHQTQTGSEHARHAPEAREWHSSIGKRPRKEKDDQPPQKRNQKYKKLERFKFITSNEDVENAADQCYSDTENSMDGFPSYSGPAELLYHQNASNEEFLKRMLQLENVPDDLLYQQRKSGIKSRTTPPSFPQIVNPGNNSWHLPKPGISTTCWHRGDKILTVKSKSDLLRFSKLLKYPTLKTYVEQLKETCPGFQGYYLCDRVTRRCIYNISKDCDLDLVIIRRD